jgi:hypothetical protein
MVAGGDGAFDDRLASPARHPERTETELWNRASICLEGFHHRLPKSAAVADNALCDVQYRIGQYVTEVR